jgi:hypothetical protein
MVTRSGVKVFGQVFGISEQARQALAADLAQFDEATWKDGVLDLFHEGGNIDLGEFMLRCMEVMAEGRRGHLDLIDHDKNEIVRYVFDREGYRSRVVPMDDTLQDKINE